MNTIHQQDSCLNTSKSQTRNYYLWLWWHHMLRSMIQQLGSTRKETSCFFHWQRILQKGEKDIGQIKSRTETKKVYKSRFLCVVLPPTLQRGLKALPLKISSLHVERTTCELKSQPAPETREEWSFRRKQQHWGSGFPSQSPFYGASNKSVARYFLFTRLSEDHSYPLRVWVDLFGWCASGASHAEISKSGAAIAEVTKCFFLHYEWSSQMKKVLFFWFFKSFWKSNVRIKFKTSVRNFRAFPRSQIGVLKEKP